MSSTESSLVSSEESSSLGSKSQSESNDSDMSSQDNDSQANCIRNRSNFSMVKSFHMLDKKDFNPDMLKIYIENDAAPKLKLLLKKIKSLDEKDMKERGKHYKHLIFTDVNRSAYGAKIIASALSTYGMNMIYHPQGTGFSVHSDAKLLETKGENFAVLLSKSFYDRPVNVKLRKAILDKFNSRPDNAYGDLIRFIILDQGFKEGIDLFDVKYVHLFEPLVVPADEKQAIGRATRFCGQKGLEFHPRYGWPLYVFKYDVSIPADLQASYQDSKTLFELYIKHSNLDMRKIIFASELEKATIGASVDADLTKAIHTFAIEKPPLLFSDRGASGSRSPQGGGATYNKTKAPTKVMSMDDMKKFITTKYSRNGMKYPKVKLMNQCTGGAVNGNIVSFTPTQDFVRHYFQPQSAYKGLLLHHSVGTGKTCTAIATATTSFDVENYTILWVTRHTLKNDIWKNMFGQVCSLDVQEKIKNGLVLPDKIGSKFRYISGNWLEPISYKQFSNMLLKRNKIYNEMVRRNGAEDPLRKTLLIIDEAHKLYSPTVAKSEQPDTDILEKMIQGSYDKSGKDSVRVLLMTATPFTEDGMEMIKLLNLLRQGNQFNTDFNAFSQQYLDINGYFTASGLKSFQNDVSGYISYLNRSQDARNFAHPVIQNIYAKLSSEVPVDPEKDNAGKITKEMREHMKEVRAEVKELKALLKGFKKQYNSAEKVKACIEQTKTLYEQKMQDAKNVKSQGEGNCKELPVKQRKPCKDDVVQRYKQIVEELKQQKVSATEECKKLKNAVDESNSEVVNANKRMSELTQEINEYKVLQQKVKAINATKKGYRQEVKALNGKRKGLQQRIKDTRTSLQQKRFVLKQKLAKLKKIDNKPARLLAIKEFRKTEPMIPEVKQLTKAMKDLRAESSQFNSEANVIKIKHGLKKIKNISQQYAISKYCNV